MRNLALALLIFLCSNAAKPCSAEAPSALALLPDSTYLLLHVPDAQELGERMQESAMVAMFTDEQVRPVIETLYGSVSPAMSGIEEQLGISIEDLMDLPLGEVAIGVVGLPGQRPAVAVIVESTDGNAMTDLLDRGTALLTDAGFVESEEEIEGTAIKLLTRTDDDVQEIAQLRIDDTLILTTNRLVMAAIAAALAENEEQGTINEVESYNAIMTRCQREGRAQVSLYVDPIGLARTATRGNLTAAAGLAFLPAIGLDGLKGLGGTIQIATDDFDSVVHGHLLLDQPRNGVLEMLTFENGPTTPEKWIPADCGNYWTLHFDMIDAYTQLGELVDTFRGEGSFEQTVDGGISEGLGINFTDDLLPAMSGRFTFTTWYERPISLTSQVNAMGIELKDPAEFRATLDKVMDRFSEQMEERTFGGTSIFALKEQPNSEEPQIAEEDAEGDEQDSERRRRRRRRGPRPGAAAAIVGNYLVICNKASFLERAILTNEGSADRLADELDYKLISNKLKRQPGGEESVMISFARPEEAMKYGYDLLQSKDVREQISRMSEDNPFFTALDKSLSENRFPPFEVIAQYMAPAGSVVTNEESGFHYVSFGLRRLKPKDE